MCMDGREHPQDWRKALPMRPELATELRDGLLQDLVAVGMIVEVARRVLDGSDRAEMCSLLDSASQTIESDLERLRAVIDRLGGPLASGE
jgi:signal transduction histidine kinase